MARPAVIDVQTGGRVPFLRGILTRSLQTVGLPFDAAYRVASAVRAELEGKPEIDGPALRKLVVRHLDRDPDVSDDLVRRYRNPTPVLEIEVRVPDGPAQPFSRGRHRESLVACGLGADEAERVSATLLTRLVREGVREIDVRRVRHRTYDLLGEVVGEHAAARYLAWEAFRHGDRPLILVIGGATGTGKSTIATRIAHRLDIVRTQSSDMLREVMRTVVPERLAPALHVSSFQAFKALPSVGERGGTHGDAVIDGFLTQADLISVAAEAIVHRAAHERVSVILEGVHLHPALHKRFRADVAQGHPDDPIVVSVMLALLSPKELKRRIKGRGKRAPDRRGSQYLKHFDDIWRVQTFLLSEADRLELPIVTNDDVEAALDEVTEVVMGALLENYHGTPDEVFGG